MVVYVLAIDNGAGGTIQVPLVTAPLGYPHVQVDDGTGTLIDIPNVPPAAPPVGRFPVDDGQGGTLLIDFTVLQATGEGPGVSFLAYVGSRINDRWRMVQLGDHSLIQFDLFDDDGPIDLNNALLLEVDCRRADRTTLTKTGTSEIPPGGTVESRLVAQLDAGDVQSFGEWLMQAHVILSGGREFRSQVRRVPGEANV